MEASNNNWADLLMKYLQMNISADELAELERQKAASPLKQAQFEKFMDSELFLQDLEAMGHINPERASEWRNRKMVNRLRPPFRRPVI